MLRMNNPTVGHLGSASNPINQDRKWTAKKSYPLSPSPPHGSLQLNLYPGLVVKDVQLEEAFN